MNDDDDVTPFSPSGQLPDPGPATTAITLPSPNDPWANPAPVLTPAEFVVNRLRLAEKEKRGLALKPHISTFNGEEFGPPLLREAEVIDEYLRNGVGQLTVDQVQFIMDILAEPESPRLAGSAQDRAAWDRALRDAINQLRVEKVRKR